MPTSMNGIQPARRRYWLALTRWPLVSMRYLAVRAKGDLTPNSASSTARVLVMVNPMPTAIRNGRKRNVRFQLFGYNSRWLVR